MTHLDFAQNMPAGAPIDLPGAAVCPACCSTETEDVFKAGELPVNVGEFYDTYSAAIDAPVGAVTLSYCRACGFVHNRKLDTSLDVFRPGYEVALHHSETFRNFITEVAERLVNRFDLRQKQILEIGCGDAYFLKKLAALGANQCTGIDPTISTEGKSAAANGTVRLIRDYFGPAHQNIDADFVCCLSVFEDIPSPGPFLAAVHALAARRNASLYFEVFNAWRAFEEQEVWSVHYEQCNYFGLNSLQNLFARHGFKIHEAGTCYQGDQYLFIEATPAPRLEIAPAIPPQPDVPEVLRSYEHVFNEKRELWNRRLSRYRNAGERVVVWGTGGKGITFLNSVSEAHAIEFVAEINPDKQGKYVPGTGQRIVSPEFLAEYQPHKIIITNALYEVEMKSQARALGVEAEFLIA
ncbi:MAG: methyltransferase domain-containing protein [Rhizobiales bacterium]|nr:methyltransferase domain-containing protein [Hyphomicrobiales bacterium]